MFSISREPKWRPDLEYLLKPALKHSQWTVETLSHEVNGDTAQLWIVAHRGSEELSGACVTQINDYPDYRALEYIALGGEDFDLWSGIAEFMEGFAKEHGCDYVLVQGRKGWVKKLPGYKLHLVELRKKL